MTFFTDEALRVVSTCSPTNTRPRLYYSFIFCKQLSPSHYYDPLQPLFCTVYFLSSVGDNLAQIFFSILIIYHHCGSINFLFQTLSTYYKIPFCKKYSIIAAPNLIVEVCKSYIILTLNEPFSPIRQFFFHKIRLRHNVTISFWYHRCAYSSSSDALSSSVI